MRSEEVDRSHREGWDRFKALLADRRYDHAEAACRAGLALGGPRWRWKLGLVWIDLARGNLHEALAGGMRLAREHPEVSEIHRTIAEVWLLLEKPDCALAWAKLGSSLEPNVYSAALVARARRATQASGRIDAPEDDEPKTQVMRRPARADTTLIIARPRQARVDLPDPEARIRALYGQGLFPEPRGASQARPHARLSDLRREQRNRRITISALALAALFGGATAVRAGISQRAESDAVKEAEGMAHLIETGSVEQLRASLPKLEALLSRADGERGARTLLARAEATIYRHLDPDPKRAERTAQLLEGAGAASADAALARALILSDTELEASAPELEKIARERPRDSEPVFLLACARAAAGDHRRAEELFRRAEELEPSHLPHLLRELSFFVERGKQREATALFEHMNDVQPTSTFTARAREKLAARGWL